MDRRLFLGTLFSPVIAPFIPKEDKMAPFRRMYKKLKAEYIRQNPGIFIGFCNADRRKNASPTWAILSHSNHKSKHL